jgi:biotin-dependent carboxylase-like uncharacterized protein
MTVEIVKPGLLVSLQDTGRPGLAHLGIGRAGAFDAPALRLANALAGNPRDTCALEFTLRGPTLRFHRDAWIAMTGAPGSLRIDDVEAPTWTPVRVPSGAVVTIGALHRGCRGYLAIHGGIDVGPVLGSRSTDVNAVLGPFERPLRAGDMLSIGNAGAGAAFPARAHPAWRIDPRPWFDPDAGHALRLLPGAHFARLTETSRAALFAEAFPVQADSNRTGVRLSGPRLEWIAPFEMVSEGCVPGLLQLPPSGQPIAFGVEGPVSGGYPRIGQIAAVDLPRLAQRRPGDALRFVPCTLDDALRELHEREHKLRQLETNIAARLAR